MFFAPQKKAFEKYNSISLFLPHQFILKGALLGLRQFLATESTLKMMKKAFYSTSEGLSKVKSTKITEKNHICTYLRKNKIFQ